MFFFVAAVLCQFGPIQFCVIDMEAFLTTKLGELQGVQDKITRLEKELSEARQLQMFLEIEVAKIRAGIVVANPEVPKTQASAPTSTLGTAATSAISEPVRSADRIFVGTLCTTLGCNVRHSGLTQDPIHKYRPQTIITRVEFSIPTKPRVLPMALREPFLLVEKWEKVLSLLCEIVCCCRFLFI